MTTDHSLTHGIVHLLVSGASVFVVAKLMPGMRVKSFFAALAFAFVVALLNVVTWHYLALLTVPIKWLTLGIGGLVLNGIIFLLAGRIVGGVKISGCFVAALASLAVTFVNHLIRGALAGWSP
jgi:putative membrane protein